MNLWGPFVRPVHARCAVLVRPLGPHTVDPRLAARATRCADVGSVGPSSGDAHAPRSGPIVMGRSRGRRGHSGGGVTPLVDGTVSLDPVVRVGVAWGYAAHTWGGHAPPHRLEPVRRGGVRSPAVPRRPTWVPGCSHKPRWTSTPDLLPGHRPFLLAASTGVFILWATGTCLAQAPGLPCSGASASRVRRTHAHPLPSTTRRAPSAALSATLVMVLTLVCGPSLPFGLERWYRWTRSGPLGSDPPQREPV